MVGGGAGGLELVTRLGRKLGKRGKASVSLIDKRAAAPAPTKVAAHTD